MSVVVMSQERRNFSRIALSRPSTLEAGGTRFACRLVDISMRGALLRMPGGLVVGEGQPCTLSVHLDAGAAVIRMKGAIAHREDRTVGVRCNEIDVESIGHLRRLLELNLGDEKLLHRELASLVAERRA
ncbi:MAG TPA: PilZ domain-containing protein [Anaeromyxobacteraceae bacterium]|nr:PilZ domain-containing protein [Anaeromyxobacteraceae bacterium]